MAFKGQHTINSKDGDFRWTIMRSDGATSVDVVRFSDEVKLSVFHSEKVKVIDIHIVSQGIAMKIDASTGAVLETRKV